MRHALIILATYRLAYLVTREEGPFSLFERLRSRVDPTQATWVGRGLNCLWCVSFWLAWLVVLLDPEARRTLPLSALSAAGGALVLDQLLE